MSRRLLVPILLGILLALSGCAVRPAAGDGPPPVGARITAAQANNLVVGERVGNTVLGWQNLTSNQDPVTGMQRTKISAALRAGRPVALFFDAAADGTEGTMEIGWMEELRGDFGHMAAFVYADPSEDTKLSAAWNLNVLHAVFLINPQGIITYEYQGLWGVGDIKPHLAKLVGLP